MARFDGLAGGLPLRETVGEMGGLPSQRTGLDHRGGRRIQTLLGRLIVTVGGQYDGVDLGRRLPGPQQQIVLPCTDLELWPAYPMPLAEGHVIAHEMSIHRRVVDPPGGSYGQGDTVCAGALPIHPSPGRIVSGPFDPKWVCSLSGHDLPILGQGHVPTPNRDESATRRIDIRAGGGSRRQGAVLLGLDEDLSVVPACELSLDLNAAVEGDDGNGCGEHAQLCDDAPASTHGETTWVRWKPSMSPASTIHNAAIG